MNRRFRAHKTRHRETAELNITAFLNLMVILVPFLLITAVFSRMAILELNLPDPGSSDLDVIQSLDLEITVRPTYMLVANKSTGPLKKIEATETGYDYTALSKFLQRVKVKFPDKIDATLLMENDTPYDVLVQTMDAVRLIELEQDGVKQMYQLFPRIAVGDAPKLGSGAS